MFWGAFALAIVLYAVAVYSRHRVLREDQEAEQNYHAGIRSLATVQHLGLTAWEVACRASQERSERRRR